MSIQARMTQNDPRLYSPARDFAHCFDYVIRETLKRAAADGWVATRPLTAAMASPTGELAKAGEAVARFVGSASLPEDTMESSLRKSGFLAVDPPAQAFLCAHLGAVILGLHWAGVREASFGGYNPALTYQTLAAEGEKFAKLLAAGPVRRALLTARYRIRGLFRRLLQRFSSE